MTRGDLIIALFEELGEDFIILTEKYGLDIVRVSFRGEEVWFNCQDDFLYAEWGYDSSADPPHHGLSFGGRWSSSDFLELLGHFIKGVGRKNDW